MKSKYPNIYFENRGGYGPLFVYVEPPPYGNVIDDETDTGAGFFSDDGRLLAVLFDKVESKIDSQIVKFPKAGSVEIKVKNGKVLELKKRPAKKTQKASVPWNELAATRIKKYSNPGLALRGARVKEGLSQADLSKKTGIAQYNLSKMETGERPIGKSLAKRLSKILKVDYRISL